MNFITKKPVLFTISITLLAVMVLFALAPVITLAADTDTGGSITDRVNQAQGGGGTATVLDKKASDVGNSLVKSLRSIAVIVAVIMFVVVGYSLLFSPNVKTIADAKGKIGALVLAIGIAMMAEEIVGTLMSWFKLN